MHWIEILCGAVSVCAVLIVLGVGTTRGIRRLGTPKATVLLIIAATLGYFVVAPATWTALTTRFAAADTMIDTSLTIPLSASTSGSAESSVSWDLLGREGRKFVSGGTDDDAVRTYVGLGAAPTLPERAQSAVDELDRAGGFDKSHIVIAVPTGSGWVDEHAVGGFEEKFGGDVATVALQYSVQPSWVTFLLAESDAKESADALVRAVSSRVDSLPDPDRPAVYVYGQSLGAIGADAAIANHPESVCGSLLAGTPAGETSTGDSVLLANSSDPVVWWSTDLLTSPPNLRSARVDAPLPQWIPIVSYLQISVDMMSALGAPAGHGHRYGTDQGTLLPTC
jgi:uncharacterized membrane protein